MYGIILADNKLKKIEKVNKGGLAKGLLVSY